MNGSLKTDGREGWNSPEKEIFVDICAKPVSLD